MIADRRAQFREFLVRKRNSRDFDGIHRGSRRTRETLRNVCTRCCNSKCRKYFCTTLGIVIRKAAVKFCVAMDRCFGGFCSSSVRQSASASAFPGR
jgi:hypothetical protein